MKPKKCISIKCSEASGAEIILDLEFLLLLFWRMLGWDVFLMLLLLYSIIVLSDNMYMAGAGAEIMDKDEVGVWA